MKTIILLIIISFSFIGCNLALEIQAADHELYYLPEFEDLDTFEKIAIYIRSNVVYRSEDDNVWSNPQDTLERGYGDCEDLAILYINIAYFGMRLRLDLAALDASTITRVATINAGYYNHIMVYWNGDLFEPQNGLIYKGTINYIIDFDEVF